MATNALELDVDIGQLSAAVLTGYPGSIASTWQQAGRAARRNDLGHHSSPAATPSTSTSASIPLSAGLQSTPCSTPTTRDSGPPHPVRRIRAAVQGREPFGASAGDDLLELLAREGKIHHTRQQYHWLCEGTPATDISLRTSGSDTVVIQEIGENGPAVIGELDLESVPFLAYEGAVYMHQARTYLVEQLDWDNRLALVRPVEVDYYTRAAVGSTVRKLAPEAEQAEGDLLRAYGDVLVISKASGYRKIKQYSHETLGYGEIDLPEVELDTTGYWLVFGEQLTARLQDEGILLQPNDYGPNWEKQRQEALARDGHRCRTCGAEARPGQGLHVHHIRPFREFGYVPGSNDSYLQANRLSNLITLCPSCHRQAEEGQRTRSALGGLAYVLQPGPYLPDVRSRRHRSAGREPQPLTRAPTVLVYERVPAGVGFSQRLFELHRELLEAALELVRAVAVATAARPASARPAKLGRIRAGSQPGSYPSCWRKTHDCDRLPASRRTG